MSGAWVAGTVRSRALAEQRMGRAGARALARCASLDDALALLAGGPYGHDVRAGACLEAAQHGVGASLLWNLRVLAGWLPPRGAGALRVLAAWFEIVRLDELLRQLCGAPAQDAHPPYRLGSLATAWPRLAGAGSLEQVRERLAHSSWGDPGGDTPADIQLTVRLVWADRVAQCVPPAAPWAAGAAALLLAREVVVGEVVTRSHRLRGHAALAAIRLLGRSATQAFDVGEFASSLPRSARWALAGVHGPQDLWRAETRWWSRVESDATRLANVAGFGLAPVVGVVTLLAVDAWRVRAALALAAQGVSAGEVFDAVV